MADDKEGPEAPDRPRALGDGAPGSAEPGAHGPRFPGGGVGIFDSVVSLLQLGGSERIAEILGGRASSWLAELWSERSLRGEAVVVVPAGAPALPEPSPDGISWISMDPLSFSANARDWDKILINQALGQIADPARLIANCAERLSHGGRLLVSELVPGPGDPLREPALRRWAPPRLEAAQVVAWLRAAGLIVLMGRVERTRRLSDRLFELEREIDTESGSDASAEDAELKAALDELQRGYRQRLSSEFTESFDLILGASYSSAASRS